MWPQLALPRGLAKPPWQGEASEVGTPETDRPVSTYREYL